MQQKRVAVPCENAAILGQRCVEPAGDEGHKRGSKTSGIAPSMSVATQLSSVARDSFARCVDDKKSTGLLLDIFGYGRKMCLSFVMVTVANRIVHRTLGAYADLQRNRFSRLALIRWRARCSKMMSGDAARNISKCKRPNRVRPQSPSVALRGHWPSSRPQKALTSSLGGGDCKERIVDGPGRGTEAPPGFFARQRGTARFGFSNLALQGFAFGAC